MHEHFWNALVATAHTVLRRNRRGEEFPCGETGKCCGDVCADQNDLCCRNSNGDDFACQGGGGSCCGNACAAPGSKCCTADNGYQYPVSKDTACAGDYKTCENREGTTFYCGARETCSGDVCVAEGGVGCVNSIGNDFPCGAGSSCCGNACAAAGSKCCKPQQRLRLLGSFTIYSMFHTLHKLLLRVSAPTFSERKWYDSYLTSEL